MKNWYLRIGLCIIGVIFLIMIVSLFYTPYDANLHTSDAFSPPSSKHLLGTDRFGRDILSRIMAGAQKTFFIAFGTVLIGVVFGTLIGSVSGYFGKWLDEVLMRFNDALLAFPGILTALVLISVAGKGVHIIIIALGIMFIPSYVRLVRGEYVRYRNLDFVNSARSVGAKPFRIMYVHILPNVIVQLIPGITIGFSNAVLAEASLSFLGLGVQPPDASWGNMVNEAQGFLFTHPWMALIPGFMIILCILGFNFLGEGLFAPAKRPKKRLWGSDSPQKRGPRKVKDFLGKRRNSGAVSFRRQAEAMSGGDFDENDQGARPLLPLGPPEPSGLRRPETTVEENRQGRLININNLTVEFYEGRPVINDISFSLNDGEILGLVGESGSGKSMTGYAIMDLLPENANVVSGGILRDGGELNDIAMIYQEPSSSLNPVMKVGRQVENAVKTHFSNKNDKELKELALKFMGDAGLTDCGNLYHYYPHQLSGGMRQRILIAMAIACKPRLIIADEPTTALDIVTRTRIVNRLRKINEKYGTAILLISHDIDVISSICGRVLVMKDGCIVEENELKNIFENPQHDYTKELIASSSLESRTFESRDTLNSGRGLGLSVKNINGYYSDRGRVKILEDISFEVKPGEIFGLVGHSGSGKSTLAKIIAGLMRDSEGSILLNGDEINGLSPGKRRKYARDIQIVFQDPFTSLNPKMKVGRFVEEPLRIHKVFNSKSERKQRVTEILSLVGLTAEHYDRYPSQLSGGQRQRVSIAAALVLNPGLIIMDEPVSAVDLTVQAQIVKLIREIHDKFNITFLFISHDLKLVKGICDRIAVIENGKLVAVKTAEEFSEETL